MKSIIQNRYDGLRREELIQMLEKRDSEVAGGIHLSYAGQSPPWQIVRRVQPRRQRIEETLSVGSEEEQSSSLIIEGENLQSMVSLYKYRGQVNLILTDPPYNTGSDFRYNDKWDEDPNDPDLGDIVPADDGSRHSKWLRFMAPRLWMMKEMLRPGGVLAICIDHRELYRLGLLLDDIFEESNRIAVINWQRSYTPRNDSRHVSLSTEYVLVYAKDLSQAKTQLLPHTDRATGAPMPDGDPREWTDAPATGSNAKAHKSMVYAIQSPFTGQLLYPPPGSAWRNDQKSVLKWVSEWGCKYKTARIDDEEKRSILIGLPVEQLPRVKAILLDEPLETAQQKARALQQKGPWPPLYFQREGDGRPRLKKYLNDLKQGKVATNYWSNDDYDTPTILDAASWHHQESGHGQQAVDELTALIGSGHDFKTVKPLKLFKKIVQLWCPADGIAMDPFAGSGTLGHAIVDLNHEAQANRRFVLIEQGRVERGDPYARTLTHLRVKHAITGERVDRHGNLSASGDPLPGGFRYVKLLDKIDGDALLALEREEMLDLLLTSHWDQSERSGSHLQRLAAGSNKYLFGVSSRGEGYFLIWSGPDKPSVLDRDAFRILAEEAKQNGLRSPFHVYARVCSYSGPNIIFYQIPNRILDKLGFNEATDPYSVESE